MGLGYLNYGTQGVKYHRQSIFYRSEFLPVVNLPNPKWWAIPVTTFNQNMVETENIMNWVASRRLLPSWPTRRNAVHDIFIGDN